MDESRDSTTAHENKWMRTKLGIECREAESHQIMSQTSICVFTSLFSLNSFRDCKPGVTVVYLVYYSVIICLMFTYRENRYIAMSSVHSVPLTSPLCLLRLEVMMSQMIKYHKLIEKDDEQRPRHCLLGIYKSWTKDSCVIVIDLNKLLLTLAL